MQMFIVLSQSILGNSITILSPVDLLPSINKEIEIYQLFLFCTDEPTWKSSLRHICVN